MQCTASAAKNTRHLVDVRYLSFIALKKERPVLEERRKRRVPLRISVQAIKSFHNYATLDRCTVQCETLKGLSVARGKKRLRRETGKKEKNGE